MPVITASRCCDICLFTDFVNKPFQVNLVRNTHHPDEDEFLFSPYSVFTVGVCDWANRTVTLTPALDNTCEPEDLPLCPWI